MQGRPRRSVPYMPGSNERALEKAKTLSADALILDLEDAVTPDAKLLAREQVCAAVKGGGYGAREIVIRVNALETPWGAEDILAACDAEPDAILGPCNEIFSPTEEDVDWSRKVIDTFGQAENAHKGVIVVEGRMVERLHFAMAQRTVAIAEQIREMEGAYG